MNNRSDIARPNIKLEPPLYQSGFGNEFATEAKTGALPHGQNSPQHVPFGLYAEQISGSAFTAPRSVNRRSWLYRLRPSAMHSAFSPLDVGRIRTAPIGEIATPPDRLRWDPWPLPSEPTDFLSGCVTLAASGVAALHTGCAVHIYVANAAMRRVFYNADGELLLVPQQGRLILATELGVLWVDPGEVAVVPRGIKFCVELPEGLARGYVCENYGAPFQLPERGPIGANGLANARDFQIPIAAFETRDEATELVVKFGGRLYQTVLGHSPLDVVAWHGNYAPYKYDLALFNVVNSVSFDHPDPSIFTVLTSPSESAGTANVDFVVFPPRWVVSEHTFRPPWFHRNIMSEFLGLIRGVYDAKAQGFAPGGMSIHNCMSAHGPDVSTFEKASSIELKPEYQGPSLAFMFETRYVFDLSAHALSATQLQKNYDSCWAGFKRAPMS